MPLFLRLTLLAALVLGLAGCGGGGEGEAARLEACTQVLGLLDPGARVVAEDVVWPGGRTVRLDYRLSGGAWRGQEAHWLACTFRGGLRDDRRLALEAVRGDRVGGVERVRLLWLSIALGLPRPDPDGMEAAPVGGAPWAVVDRVLYLAQQILNGVSIACVYALLALGYTLVFGVTGRINLAFGGLYTLGAFASTTGVAVLLATGLFPALPALLAVAAAAVVWTAGAGWMMERLAFRRVHRAPTQAPLVASLGVALMVAEGVRLLTDARDIWPPQVLHHPLVLAEGRDLDLTVTPSVFLVAGLTATALAALWWLLARSRLGRELRATADDAATARLLGVDTARALSVAFALGGACAALAGFVVAIVYGGVNAYMGWLIGFKALTAAVVGGIGSPVGAVIGGGLVALLDTLWAAYLPGAWRDVAVFGLLVLVLTLRPTGLLGLLREQRD